MSPATVSLSQHSFLTLANLVLSAPSSCRQCWVTARHHKSFPERFLHTPATAPSPCPLLWRSPSNFQSLKAQTEFRCHPQRGSTVFISCFQNSQLSHCDREHTVLGHTKSKGSAWGSELESVDKPDGKWAVTGQPRTAASWVLWLSSSSCSQASSNAVPLELLPLRSDKTSPDGS